MKERTYGIILGILNLVLLVVCVVLFLQKDKTAPQILLTESNPVYDEGAGTDLLFEGVRAHDQEDGDLTNELVIEKIVVNQGKETATITYGVADNAGNVGKATCTVTMVAKERVEDILPTAGEAGNQGQATAVETMVQTEEEEPSTEQQQNPEATEERENTTQVVESRPDIERPTMTFKTREITIKAGTDPDWKEVFEGLHDDKDDYETLLETLQIRGEYNKEEAGTYQVTLTVKDSDGNESNAYPLKITVEASN